MEKRALKTSGFVDTDRDMLQKEFNEEFKRDLEDLKAKRREQKRRQAQQEGIQKRRLLMEKTLQEEQTELARNYQVQTVIELIKENMVGKTLRIGEHCFVIFGEVHFSLMKVLGRCEFRKCTMSGQSDVVQ